MSDYAIDSHKLMYHPVRVATTLASQDSWEVAKDNYPIYLEVSPVGHCSHRCTFCAVDYLGYNVQSLDFNTYKERISEMSRLGVKSVMFAGEGEPLLHKQIADMVEVAKEAGIDVAFTTNGVALTQKFIESSLKHISWIKVSFNAGFPDTYAKIHGTKERDYTTVLNNLKNAVVHKHENNLDCTIGLQCVLLPDNAAEITYLAKVCRGLDLDYLVVKPYSQHNSSETRLYENLTYESYYELAKELEQFETDTFKIIFREGTMKKLEDKSEPYSTCLSTPNLWAYVMSNGIVSACSAYLGNPKFELGNINTQTFQEIWHSDKRKALFEDGIDISECRKGCRMDSCNRYLDDIANGNIKHVNFI